MAGFALEKPAPISLANEFAFPDGYLAANGHDMGPAFNRHPFESVVIHINTLRFRRDGSPILRIVNDQVCIAAGLNRALPGKQTKQFRGLGAGRIHKAVQIQSAAPDAVGVEGVDAILERRNAIGDSRKIAFTLSLLRGEM